LALASSAFAADAAFKARSLAATAVVFSTREVAEDTSNTEARRTDLG
jgi:hypothetical protein